MTPRIVIVGAAGRLGASITHAFAGCSVIGYTHALLDVTDADAVRAAMADAAPDVIVNCAAFNNVDAAEDRAAEAFAVNAFAVRSLALAAERGGATLVHFSTDFVFDGTANEPYDETMPPSPRSTYALSKLLGEWFAAEAPRSFVLRVESLFGSPPGWSGRRGTMDTIVQALARGEQVKVFTDRVVSPAYAEDVAAATRHLVTSGAAPGLYHCVNAGRATWYDVALEAARIMGIDARLQPITMDQMPLKAPRPRFCAMANQKLAAAGFVMPPWQDAMRRWLVEAKGVSRMNGIHG
jgi:dTDP-4-dehydrorhamnose reductase